MSKTPWKPENSNNKSVYSFAGHPVISQPVRVKSSDFIKKMHAIFSEFCLSGFIKS